LLNDVRAHYAVVVLIEDDTIADALVRILTDLCTDRTRLTVHVPPVRSLGFFADGRAQRQLDAWWESEVPRDAPPLFVVAHREGLPGWLDGLDGRCYVGVRSAEAAAEYRHLTDVQVVSSGAPLDYAAAVMNDLAADGLYDRAEVDRAQSMSERARLETRRDTSSSPFVVDEDGQGPDPFDLLIAMTLGEASGKDRSGTPPESATSQRVSQRRTLHLPAWARGAGARRGEAELADRGLAEAFITRGSTIVVVGSRKGGVGKTSHAAGIAIVVGTALDAVGRCTALVDANLANPDAWGQLNLPVGAATVRDVIAALVANNEPPRPVHASTPSLACYPESRDTSEYSRTEIGFLAAYLRDKYPLIVIDLSNRLPDVTAGPEAAAAAFWLEHADVLVLPSAASKQDFNGVLDYLDMRDLPPVIVASLVARSRRNREHPLAKRYMSAIAQRSYRVVDVPDDAERVRYAGMQGVPVETVSAALKAAYRELAMAIAQAPVGAPR
jgi:MinD-like ATPase involved in chromosome partitioning or flagellar assembly